MRSKVKMITNFGPMTFADWFEFADWCKQLNERGQGVMIISWEYVHNKPMKWR